VAGEDADPGDLHRFGPLAYHAISFASAGHPLYVLSTHAARYLVEGAPDGEPTPPSEAGYVQLPQHLFWTRAGGGSPESVDGIFWSATPSGRLHALLVTGIRPDRPGLGVVPLPAGPLDEAATWLDLEARVEEEDFATDLPGAELDALYEIRTAGEVFKLLGRFFAHLDASPDAVADEQTVSAGRTSSTEQIPSTERAASTDGTRSTRMATALEDSPDADDRGIVDGPRREGPTGGDAAANGQGGPAASALPFRRVTLGEP
jgi:hypothetical protein